jgi:predicted transposase/invertase (TIGR01784 family)
MLRPRYIDPKTDFAFKKIFGSTGSEHILRSFLNGILYGGQPTIASLRIVEPYSIPRVMGMKDTYLDVRAVLEDGQHIIIEMQVLNIPGMEQRVLYNAAKEYGNQLLQGEDYTLLNPVVALTLADFEMFPEAPKQMISRFKLFEKKRLLEYPDGDLELVFVELTKFNCELSNLKSLTDEWLYFLGHAGELSTIPTPLTEVAEIKEAFEKAERAGLTEEEEHALTLKRQWIADQRRAHHTHATTKAELRRSKAELKQSKVELKQSKAELKQNKAELKAKDSKLKAQQAQLLKAVKLLVASGMSESAARKQMGL